MPALSIQDRPALLDEQKSLKDAQAGWGGVMAVLTGLSAFVAPAVATAPIAVGGVLLAVLKRKQNAVDRILDDPPRYDYATGTRARSRRYIQGRLGDDALATATDAVAVSTLDVVAFLEAAVRADERAQGADEHGDAAVGQQQLLQAALMMDRARIAEAELSRRLDAFGIQWAAFAASADFAGLPVPPPPARRRALPARARRALDRTGLVVADLDLHIAPEEPLEYHRLPGELPPSRSFFDVGLDVAQQTRALARSAAGVAAPSVAIPEQPEYEAALAARDGSETKRASSLMQHAAEHGSADAMFELAIEAHRRDDDAGARRWLRQAADRVSSDPTFRLVVATEDERSLADPPKPPRLERPPED